MKITFKRLLICFLTTLLLNQLIAQPNSAFVPAASNITGSEFPKISDDLKVSLRIKAPSADKVQLAGGLLPKPVDMAKDEDGNWTIITPPVAPGFHYYWFLVDGVQVNDPGSNTYHGWAKPTSGIEVPSKGEDFFLVQNVPHGDVREHWYYSDITGKWRRAFVYTPPDYETNFAKNYPLLYLLHGSGENERGWSMQGHMSFIMDNLIASKNTTPMVVVMDNGYAVDKNAPVASQGIQPVPGGSASSRTNRYSTLADVYIKEIIPSMESFYRIKPGRESRAQLTNGIHGADA